MISIDSIAIPVAFKRLCEGQNGGINCLLYAIASTGGLTTGDYPPRGCDSDEQWYLTIWRNLADDVFHVSLEDNDDRRELLEFEFWVNEQVARLEESYGLANWDTSSSD